MDDLLKLLEKNSARNPAHLAAMLGISEEETTEKIRALEADGNILAYGAILNEDKVDTGIVRAVIEVMLTPERGDGFDRMAERIAKHDEVKSCYLMSGAYDLLVIVEDADIKKVASFVAKKLSTIEGVTSTVTHFMLKTYKFNNVLMKQEHKEERLAVSA